MSQKPSHMLYQITNRVTYGSLGWVSLLYYDATAHDKFMTGGLLFTITVQLYAPSNLHSGCHFYSKTCFSVGSYTGSDP